MINSSATRNIRHIFLSPQPAFPLATAASLLGMTAEELEREIEDGGIVAVSVGGAAGVARDEMIAAAVRRFGIGAIEAALGRDAAAVLPEAMRLVELRARVPRYQRDMLDYLADRDGITVGELLTRELEDVASAASEELAAAVPGFAAGFGWPERASDCESARRSRLANLQCRLLRLGCRCRSTRREIRDAS